MSKWSKMWFFVGLGFALYFGFIVTPAHIGSYALHFSERGASNSPPVQALAISRIGPL